MKLHYRPEIDGLRAIAVIPVILFHAGFSAFSGGFVGVDVFFVISGYLITSIIMKDVEAGKFSYWEFYERRARRILPALFFVILCCMPFAWMWMMPAEMKAFSMSVVSVCLFASNILFARQTGYFDTEAELKPLLHTWSLAVEEQFYLFFPIIILPLWLLGRRRLIWSIAIFAVLSLALSEYASRYHSSFNFYWLPTRAWELMAGALCSFANFRPNLSRDNVLSLAGLCAIALAVLAYDETIPFPSTYALVPVLGTCAIILFAREGTAIRYALSATPVVGIGLISYSAYLWHQPLFAFARIRSLNEPSWQLMLALAATSLVLAYLSWRFVEAPARKPGAWPLPSRRAVFSILGTVGAVFVAIGTMGVYTNGFRSRISPSITASIENGSATNPRPECNGRQPADSCIYGDAKAIRVALLGDSHAHALAHVLGNELGAKGLGMREVTRPGCPPIRSFVRIDKEFNDYGEFYQSALDAIRANPSIDTVILYSRWSLFIELERFDNGEGGHEPGARITPIVDGDRGDDGRLELKRKTAELYKKSVYELLALGKKVVLVYPQPEVGWETPSFLAKSEHFDEKVERPLSTSYARFQQRSRNAYQALDDVGENASLVRVFPERIFCNASVKDRCLAEDGQNLFYFDNNHINNIGAALVTKEIVGAMKQKGWIEE